MPFPMGVAYWERGRGPDVLWTTPWLRNAKGQVVAYLAAGPAGQPAAEHLVAQVDLRAMPGGVQVKVLSEQDGFGRTVYAVPRHTAN